MTLKTIIFLLVVAINFQGLNSTSCPKNSDLVETGRDCRKSCISNDDCKAPNKTCSCDGDCGMSCFNTKATCSFPEVVADGSRTVSGLVIGSTVTYNCNRRYILRGHSKRICRADKEWHPQPAPTCERYCSRPNTMVSNAFINSDASDFPIDATVFYRCKTGYYTFDTNLDVTCTLDGWTQPEFSCYIQSCNEFRVARGSIAYSSGTVFGSTATLTCDEGYEPSSRRTRAICGAQLANSERGRWTSKLAKCIKIICDLPPRNIPNGRIISSEPHNGGRITYECDGNYKFRGTRMKTRETITCQHGRDGGNNEWMPDANALYCELKPCELPTAPENGAVEYHDGDNQRARYTCRGGFTLFGNSVATCNEERSWGEIPDCFKSNYDCNFESLSKPFCDYDNRRTQWRREVITMPNAMRGYAVISTSGDAELVSPIIPAKRGVPGFVCLKFKYMLTDQRFGVTVESTAGSQYQGIHWSTNPEERALMWLNTAITIPRHQSVQYQFKASGPGSRINDIRIEPQRCNNHCESEPCQHGGACVNREEGFTCFCTKDYEGHTCDIDLKCVEPDRSRPYTSEASITYSSARLLLPGSSVTYSCLRNYRISGSDPSSFSKTSTCERNRQSGSSEWNPPLWSINCEEDYCKSEPCQHGGTCQSRNRGFTCFCTNEYGGDTCDIDLKCAKPARSRPYTSDASITYSSARLLLPGSLVTYSCLRNYRISGSDPSSYSKTSTCMSNRQGGRSEWHPPLWSIRCQEDYCKSEPCQHGGTCQSRNGGFTCFCTNEYGGDTCGIEILCNEPPNYIEFAYLVSPRKRSGEITYECRRRYKFPGDGLQTRRTATCQRGHDEGNSRWVPYLHELYCERITCNAPGAAHRTTVFLAIPYSGPWKVGERVRFECAWDYEFERGVSVINEVTCLDTGKWSRKVTPCMRKPPRS